MFVRKVVHVLYTIETLCSPVLDQNYFLTQFSRTARNLSVCVCVCVCVCVWTCTSSFELSGPFSQNLVLILCRYAYCFFFFTVLIHNVMKQEVVRWGKRGENLRQRSQISSGTSEQKINETRVEGLLEAYKVMGWRNDVKESFTRFASELLSKNFSAMSDDHLRTSSSRNVDDGREMTGQWGVSSTLADCCWVLIKDAP